MEYHAFPFILVCGFAKPCSAFCPLQQALRLVENMEASGQSRQSTSDLGDYSMAAIPMLPMPPYFLEVGRFSD